MPDTARIDPLSAAKLNPDAEATLDTPSAAPGTKQLLHEKTRPGPGPDAPSAGNIVPHAADSDATKEVAPGALSVPKADPPCLVKVDPHNVNSNLKEQASVAVTSQPSPPSAGKPAPQCAKVIPTVGKSDLKKELAVPEMIQPTGPPSTGNSAPHSAAKASPPDAKCDSKPQLPETTRAGGPTSTDKLATPAAKSSLQHQIPETTPSDPAFAAKEDPPPSRKMLSVQGFIRSVTQRKFIAAFAIDHKCYSVVGRFNINVPEFISTVATLQYEVSNQLVPSKLFTGSVNETNLTLKSEPAGVWVVEADHPAIVIGNEVSGESSWRVD